MRSLNDPIKFVPLSENMRAGHPRREMNRLIAFMHSCVSNDLVTFK